MAQDYDKIFSELLVEALPTLASLYQLLPDQASFEPLPLDLQYTEERKADQLWKVTTPSEAYLIHWEIQVKNESGMLARMLLYYGLLYHRYKLPVKQVVLFIGKESASMVHTLKSYGLDFSYKLIDIREVSYRRLLETRRPDVATLAILSGLDTADTRLAIRQILTTLVSNSEGLKSSQHLSQLIRLAQLRNLQDITLEEIEAMALQLPFELKDDFFYKRGQETGQMEGKAQGRAEGQMEGKAQGRAEGKLEASLAIAREMLASGETIEKIMRFTGLTRQAVDSLV